MKQRTSRLAARGWCTPVAAAVAGGIVLTSASTAFAEPVAPPNAAAPAEAAKPAAPTRFDIDEFRVDGAEKLPMIDIEEAIYPFLGPNKTAADVEKARAALEKSYHDRGFQTVAVAALPESGIERVVVLKASESKIGRLRVTNAKYHDIDTIKKKAPSLKEGELPNFKDVTADLVALNQQPDRRITPTLRAGLTPGTVDVDLNVEDKLPLHGSLGIDNRQAANTTPTRVNAAVRYDNLWQLGHSVSLGYQVAPERPDDSQVISASYLARLTDWTGLLVYGVDSKSDITSVGGMDVVGPGQILGARAVLTLPSRDNFFHTLSLGADYKHFGQMVRLGGSAVDTPISYVPLGATYGATWQTEESTIQANLGLTANLRGFGSDASEWDAKRYNADANFAHVNGDVSYTQAIAEGFQLFAKVKGQLADGPLISSEQFSIGGADTVRGFLESAAIGDSGLAGTLELRSPDLSTYLTRDSAPATGAAATFGPVVSDWRVFGFVDGGFAKIHEPLPDQKSLFSLWSYGVGTRAKLFDHLNGTVALALPMSEADDTHRGDGRLLFSLIGDF